MTSTHTHIYIHTYIYIIYIYILANYCFFCTAPRPPFLFNLSQRWAPVGQVQGGNLNSSFVVEGMAIARRASGVEQYKEKAKAGKLPGETHFEHVFTLVVINEYEWLIMVNSCQLRSIHIYPNVINPIVKRSQYYHKWVAVSKIGGL